MGEADAVLVTASNGLSISEGLNIFADDAAFDELFGDLKERCGVRSIIQGTMAPWPSDEERRTFLARLVQRCCNEYSETGVMTDLKAVVGGKPYFILTSNGECHFGLAGFDPERVWEVEGNWSGMQCARACCPDVRDAFPVAAKLAEAETCGRVPADLVPRRPRCGAPCACACSRTAISSPTSARARFDTFLATWRGKRLFVPELGIGPRDRLIKEPVMRLVQAEPNATYVTVSLGEVLIPAPIAPKSFGIDARTDDALQLTREATGR